jgi:hypothetical protein
MKEITKDDVLYWLGTDAYMSDMIDILYDLTTGEYEVEQMKKDIINFAERFKEES